MWLIQWLSLRRIIFQRKSWMAIPISHGFSRWRWSLKDNINLAFWQGIYLRPPPDDPQEQYWKAKDYSSIHIDQQYGTPDWQAITICCNSQRYLGHSPDTLLQASECLSPIHAEVADSWMQARNHGCMQARNHGCHILFLISYLLSGRKWTYAEK